MKRILVGFLLGYGLTTFTSVRAQEEHAAQVLPSEDLTVKELVEYLAEYEVKHVAQQPFFPPAYGVTDFSSQPPAIWVFRTGTTTTRRQTVIHEVLHVRYHERGINPPEEFIAAEEWRQYRTLFVSQP